MIQRESPALVVCPCPKKRPLITYEHLGVRRFAPLGKRYDTHSGKLLDYSIPEISHFADSSRGGSPLPCLTFPLPEGVSDSHSQIFESDIANISTIERMTVCAPPLAAGQYLIHRAWSGDRYLIWSLSSGKLIHQIAGDPRIGLSASPVWDGCGVGAFVSPQLWERYNLVPDLDPQPLSVQFPAPVCENAAPLMISSPKRGKAKFDGRYLCAALTDGLVVLSLNSLDSQNPDLVYLKQWSHSKEYYSPVCFSHEDESQGKAVIGAHPNGSAHAVFLSDDFQPLEEITLQCVESQGTLLPPIVSPEGLWLIRLTDSGFDAACVENPSDLRNPLVWKSVPRFTPIPDANFWTPLAAGKPASPDDPRRQTHQPRVILLGRNSFYDINQYRLANGTEIQPVTFHPGTRIHPALMQVYENNLILGDYLTGNVYRYSLPEARLIELSPLGTRLRDLIGGPAMLGKTIVWPTRFGLHAQPL